MSGVILLAHLTLERLSWKSLPRVPEPEPVMNDLVQNEAYSIAGRQDGVLAFFCFYHALQISMLIRGNDRVLDLGCGPANQLAQIARLNPDAHFTGLDASAEMLARAGDTIRQLANISLVRSDMTNLSGIADASMDCVISTMSLHHLPDTAALSATMREVRRVLKPGGGIYFVDFGRFKHLATQRFFAQDLRDSQSASFMKDYFNSLRAAFSVEEFLQAAQVFASDVSLLSTPLAPFTVILKSHRRRAVDDKLRTQVQHIYRHMSPGQQEDFQLYARWLNAGGITLPFSPG